MGTVKDESGLNARECRERLRRMILDRLDFSREMRDE